MALAIPKKAHTRTFILLTALVLTLAFSSFILVEIISTGNVIQTGELIKIGVIGHFSGEYADYGIPMKNAIELAVKETNSAGGILGKKLSLVIEDDATDQTKSATGINKLVSIDNLNYIFSAQGSGATSSIIPIAENNKRVLMITLASAPGLTTNKNYVFRSVPSDNYQASKIVQFLNSDLKPLTLAGLYRNDPYGIGIKSIIEANAEAEVLAGELYDPSSSDFKTQLAKIKASNPDVLIIAGAKDNYPLILKQIKELNLKSKVIASETFFDKSILAEVGSLAEGAYTLFQDELSDYLNFKSNYQEEFGEEPSAYSMYAYDGAISLIKAINSSKNKPSAVRASLYSISFNGASGAVSFDSEGDRTGIAYTIYQVVNGEFVELK